MSRQRPGNVLNFHIPWTTPGSIFVTGILSKNERAIGWWGAEPPQTFFCRGLYLPPVSDIMTVDSQNKIIFAVMFLDSTPLIRPSHFHGPNRSY